MNQKIMNYDTLLKIAEAISSTRDTEEVLLLTTESVARALEVKGASLFLINRKTRELELAASFGLSKDYLNKGPISALKSIAQSLDSGPVAIYDVADDPRIQYPEAAKKEGIESILSVSMNVRGNVIGALRIYTAEHWEFTLEDVNFVQAVAQIAGMSIEMSRFYKGLKDSIEILKMRREPKQMNSKKRTPYEGVPESVSPESISP